MSHFLASKSSIAAKCELGDNRFELAEPPWNDLGLWAASLNLKSLDYL